MDKLRYRPPYSFKEVIGCLYVARFGESEKITLEAIRSLTPRSLPSVKMKVSNIVSQLQERSLPTHPSLSPLTGLTTGEKGRLTHWTWIQPHTSADRDELEELFLRS